MISPGSHSEASRPPASSGATVERADSVAARRSLARALRISTLHVGWSVTQSRASLVWIASTLLSLPYWG